MVVTRLDAWLTPELAIDKDTEIGIQVAGCKFPCAGRFRSSSGCFESCLGEILFLELLDPFGPRSFWLSSIHVHAPDAAL